MIAIGGGFREIGRGSRRRDLRPGNGRNPPFPRGFPRLFDPPGERAFSEGARVMKAGRNPLFRGFDDFFWGLSAGFAHSPESLCELETPDGPDRTLALGSDCFSSLEEALARTVAYETASLRVLTTRVESLLPNPSCRDNPEFDRFDNRIDAVFFTPHLDNSISFHRSERPGKVPGLPSRPDCKVRHGFRPDVPNRLQQGPIVVTQNLGQRLHRREPYLRFSGFRPVFSASDRQNPFANLLLGHDPDHKNFHGLRPLLCTDAVRIRKKIDQKLGSVPEFIGHPFVRYVLVLVVPSPDLACVPELLWGLDSMRIVVGKNPPPIGIVKRKRITDTVRNIRARIHAPSLDLDPEPVALIHDLSVEIKQCLNPRITLHTALYHQLIMSSSLKNLWQRRPAPEMKTPSRKRRKPLLRNPRNQHRGLRR